MNQTIEDMIDDLYHPGCPYLSCQTFGGHDTQDIGPFVPQDLESNAKALLNLVRSPLYDGIHFSTL
jgi:hypothetical protein